MMNIGMLIEPSVTMSEVNPDIDYEMNSSIKKFTIH